MVRAGVRVGRRRHASSSRGPTTGSRAASRSTTGRSAWSTRSGSRSRRTGHADGVRRAAAAAARAHAARLGRHLRLQRRAHDGRVPRVAAHAELPELRGRRRQRRLDRPHAGDHARAPAAVRGRSGRAALILVDQQNKGLSVARNVGADAATRRDHRVHRLRLRRRSGLARPSSSTFVRSGFVAVGGPNFPPPEPSLVPAAVAVSPGGPTHVLLERRGGRAHPRLQHGLHEGGAARGATASSRSSRRPATTSISAGACRTAGYADRLQRRRRPSGTTGATR